MTEGISHRRWGERVVVVVGPRLRALRYGLYHVRQSRLAVLGLLLVLLYLVVALAAPWIAPLQEGQRDPYDVPLDFSEQKLPPSAAHPFGTGESGVDIFQGVVWGSRISMVMGLAVTAFGAVVGTLLGGLAGYFGGRFDELVMRITDVFLAMPLLVVAMGVAVALGPGLTNIGLALALVWWPSYTRLVRGQVLSLREQPFVEAARATGAGHGRIVVRHVIPNALSPVLVQATLDIGTVILVSSALSFIGFGPGGPGFAEWGNLVSRGQSFMLEGWWGVTFPGLAIFGFALGFNLFGDGLRDLLDPRMRT